MGEAGPSVLVLHRMGNPRLVPAFLPGHVRSFERSWPDGACLFHDVSLPLPDWVRFLPFEAVFLDVTLLATRWMGPAVHGLVRDSYSFVRDLPALRVAFPQDEYDCSGILDDWMCDWKVDVVVSVIDGHREVLYPRFGKVGEIETGFTGYVDEALIDRAWPPSHRRPIDIGYRAKRLPPYFGRLGELKWTIGRDTIAMCEGLGLRLDIAVGDGAALPGGHWLDFVGSCRAMLGSPSGSSILDRDGSIQRRVRAFVSRHPHATFEEVEAACFPGKDGERSFTAISPRSLEAALAGTAQLLAGTGYSGVMDPGVHYFQLDPGAANIRDAVELLRDQPALERMASRCREAVLAHPGLRISARDSRLRAMVIEHRHRNRLEPDVRAVLAGVERYRSEMDGNYRALWRRQAVEARIRRWLDRAPQSMFGRIRRSIAHLRGRN